MIVPEHPLMDNVTNPCIRLAIGLALGCDGSQDSAQQKLPK